MGTFPLENQTVFPRAYRIISAPVHGGAASPVVYPSPVGPFEYPQPLSNPLGQGLPPVLPRNDSTLALGVPRGILDDPAAPAESEKPSGD
jgi:hypothetical protein